MWCAAVLLDLLHFFAGVYRAVDESMSCNRCLRVGWRKKVGRMGASQSFWKMLLLHLAVACSTAYAQP